MTVQFKSSLVHTEGEIMTFFLIIPSIHMFVYQAGEEREVNT